MMESKRTRGFKYFVLSKAYDKAIADGNKRKAREIAVKMQRLERGY